LDVGEDAREQERLFLMYMQPNFDLDSHFLFDIRLFVSYSWPCPMLLEAIVSKNAIYRGRYIYFFHQVVQWCSAAAGSYAELL